MRRKRKTLKKLKVEKDNGQRVFTNIIGDRPATMKEGEIAFKKIWKELSK